MNPERWERLQHLFDEAVALPDEERSLFIQSSCGDDSELREKISALLAAHKRSAHVDTLPTSWLAVLAPSEPATPSGFVSGQRVAERYLIRQRLGRGGMGDVFEVWDEELSIPVALKTIHLSAGAEEAHKRLKLEGMLARAVWHPNICRLYDLGRHGEGENATWFLTMELLSGETLAKRLLDKGPLPLDRAQRFAEQMAGGLGAAHRAGVVHRDFKTANVMLVPKDGDEQAIVTDFGIARAAGQESRDDRRQGPARVEGTPAYMAPEQVRGESAGPAADIYALGIVLYEMVTGTLPFAGGSATDVARRRLFEDAPSPRSVVPDLDERWEEVIRRCLERQPGRRFRHAEEVADALAGRSHVELDTLGFAGRGWHTLPVERDVFVGREAELSALTRLFSGSGRLVTLVGTGGMGKTRLAVRYGWQNLGTYPGGVWFCDLTEARDSDTIASTVAGVLGIQLGKGDPLEQLGHAIAGHGECLLILDNFEQVADHAADTVGHWLDMPGNARFLITSRERLRLRQEHVQVLDSLSPENGLELFATRARWLRPALELVGSESDAAQEIVRLVDGMPLAIELAAARMRVMSAAQILAQIRKRFQLLTGGGNARHETLALAIDGSWELLSPWEQSAWAQCAVFEGGFTLDAAEAIVDLSAWPDAPWVVDAMQSLVDKSLLRTWMPASGSDDAVSKIRFGMYVSLQEYARSKLGEEQDQLRAAEERHGYWFARFGNERIKGLDRHEGVERRRALQQELENLVAACRRAVARADPERALPTYQAAANAMLLGGSYDAAARLGREVLGVLTAQEHRASALFLVGWADLYFGRMEEAQQELEAALAIFRELGDRASEGRTLGTLGILLSNQGRVAEAQANHELELAINRELGNREREGVGLVNLGECRRKRGQMEAARADFEAGLAICREVGNRRVEGTALNNLGQLHRIQGRKEEALACLEGALAVHRDLGNKASEGVVFNALGCVYFELGDLAMASHHFQAAVAMHRKTGSRMHEGFAVGNLGNVLFERGDLEHARMQFETALAICREVGNPFGAVMALNMLGTVYLKQGRLEEARDFLRQGEALRPRAAGSIEFGLLLGTRAELEFQSGDLTRARAILAEADALAVHAGAGPDSELGGKLALLRELLSARKENEPP